MNTGELLTRVRDRLAADVGTGSANLWSDSELISDYANQARTSLFRRTRWMVIDSTTATDLAALPLCSITVTALTASYAMSPKILSIERIMLSTGTRPLVSKSRAELDAYNPQWQTADAAEPWAYCTDMDSDKIVLFPKPVTSGTASLSVYRFPLAPLDPENDTADLGFREEYHFDLIPGIMGIALQKWDSESENKPLGLAYDQKFESRCEDIKDELLRRKPRSNTNQLHQAFISGGQ